MSYPNYSLTDSIRAALAAHGVRNARVVIDLLPANGQMGVSGNENGMNGDFQVVQPDDMEIIINEREGVMLVDGTPAQQPLEPPKTLPPPRAHSPSGTVSEPPHLLVRGDGTRQLRKHHLLEKVEDGNGYDFMEKVVEPTTKSDDALPHGSFVGDALSSVSPERNAPIVPLENFHKIALSNDLPEGEGAGEGVPHDPTTPMPGSSLLKSPSTLFPTPQTPDDRREMRGSSSLSAASQSGNNRKTSVVLVEKLKAPAAPVRTKPSGLMPVFSILNTEHNEQIERPPSNASSRKVSSVHLVESPVVEEPKHQPHVVEGSEAVRKPGILVTGASSKTGQTDAKSGGFGGSGELKFPHVGEPGSQISASSESNTNLNGNMLKNPKSHVDFWKLGGKQRLQEMLREQREMEQQDRLSRAKHEEIIEVAEKALQRLEQKQMASKGEGELHSLPKISLRTGPASSRPAAALSVSPRSSLVSPSNTNGTNGIKVLRFTLPARGKAKEEVVSQLSTSLGGSQLLSSKDKYSMLLQEQERILRQNEEGEDEYKKLLERAVAFHEQQKELSRLREEEGSEGGEEDDPVEL
ncbi:hypothetical protein MOQ_007750 [Trypanosoma cruzi marinkellei]|uniref:Uncharacterized protein n=1 Tax=Trypanosoma cruzi marinkellei TaxID=85056 RepID=K2N1U1_TRYCR|nr:hypothetical protein MOQ_007750 [Trypanosoma cruzi marinkellei]